MGFSWSTFVIEIVNFAVLVWILTRFLYQPVTRAIETRRRTIQEEMQNADEVKQKSEALAKQYEGRLADWEAEKSQLKAAFENELGAERARRETELRASLQREREQAQAAAQARDREESRRLRQQALRDGARFCARLLSRIASPEVEQRLVDAAIEDVRAMPAEQRASLARAFDGRAQAIVTTRYRLDDGRRAALGEALASCVGGSPELRFEQSDRLVAGLRVDLGTMTLEGNLAGELEWFARASEA